MHQLDCTAFGSWLRGAAITALTMTVGPSCAHQQGEEQKKVATAEKLNELKSRVEELEKTNGRLSVRIDEMEDDLFLVQDRVEAHRLALRRRDYMNPNDSNTEARARAPRETPETNYGGGEGRYPVRESSPDRRSAVQQQPRGDNGYRRPVKRIPLNQSQTEGQQRRRNPERSDKRGHQEPDQSSAGRVRSKDYDGGGDDGSGSDKIVITDKDFREFARQNSSDSSKNAASGDSDDGGAEESTSPGAVGRDNASETSGKESEARVTEEKLEPTEEETPKDEPRPTEASGENPFEDKSGLETYKAALGKYRSAEYATALKGFQAFMDGNPQADYRDNGLYWIGECHYGMGDFRTAVEYFQRLLNEQPDGNKVPDAMLKMALAYRELDMSDKARKLLEKLTRRYPSTNAGRLGEKKLSDLES